MHATMAPMKIVPTKKKWKYDDDGEKNVGCVPWFVRNTAGFWWGRK